MAQNYTAPGRDLSEYFRSEFVIRKGSVVEIGGPYEVQLCDTANSTAIVGIVTEDSSYVMNEVIHDGKPRTLVALIGRVDALVYGVCNKGDTLVTTGAGYLTKFDPATDTYVPGSIVARAMVAKSSTGGGTIEVLLARS